MAETDRSKLSRRAFLKLVGASAASTILGSGSSDNKFRIEPLPSAVESFVQPSYTQPRVLESQKNIEITSLEEFRPLYCRIEEFKAKWKVVPPF